MHMPQLAQGMMLYTVQDRVVVGLPVRPCTLEYTFVREKGY